jgi:hypothetical protein
MTRKNMPHPTKRSADENFVRRIQAYLIGFFFISLAAYVASSVLQLDTTIYLAAAVAGIYGYVVGKHFPLE